MCNMRRELKAKWSMICHLTINLRVIVSLLLFSEQLEWTVLVRPACKEQENDYRIFIRYEIGARQKGQREGQNRIMFVKLNFWVSMQNCPKNHLWHYGRRSTCHTLFKLEHGGVVQAGNSQPQSYIYLHPINAIVHHHRISAIVLRLHFVSADDYNRVIWWYRFVNQ